MKKKNLTVSDVLQKDIFAWFDLIAAHWLAAIVRSHRHHRWFVRVLVTEFETVDCFVWPLGHCKLICNMKVHVKTCEVRFRWKIRVEINSVWILAGASRVDCFSNPLQKKLGRWTPKPHSISNLTRFSKKIQNYGLPDGKPSIRFAGCLIISS